MVKIVDYRDLDIWKKGMEIVEDIYKITTKFPNSELYGLVSQMRRAAIAIPSNIAEGFVRRHNKESMQFFNIARSSIAELETQIEIACRLSYMPDDKKVYLIDKTDHESRMIMNMIKAMKTQKRDNTQLLENAL